MMVCDKSEEVSVYDMPSVHRIGDMADVDVLEDMASLPGKLESPAFQRMTSLVYIERSGLGPFSSGASTTDAASSFKSERSSTRAKTIQMVQTPGQGVLALRAESLDKEKLSAFKDRLHAAGIDITAWGYGGSKSVEHLFWETYEQKGCIVIGESPMMKRVTRLVKVKLVAEIFGVDHTLFSRMQFMYDGQTVERRQVPLRKLTWDRPEDEISISGSELSAEDCPYTEDWKFAYKKTLEERLGLSQAWQTQHLIEDTDAYKFSVEDNVTSDGYPGLNTLYCIHEIQLRVREPEHSGVKLIGLPEGQEFATAEGDFNFNGQECDQGHAIGTQLNIWTWERSTTVAPLTRRAGSKSFSIKSSSGTLVVPPSATAPSTLMKPLDTNRLIQRVPLPTLSAKGLGGMRMRLQAHPEKHPPSTVLWACMQTVSTDWAKAKRIASRITDPKYGLKEFNSDLSAFPELNLYLLDSDPSQMGSGSMEGTQTTGVISSGRTVGDEFQRTIGAFYAIYWLMRLDTDGQDGFSNGVDEEWNPIKLTESDDLRVTQGEKRLNFHKNAQWSFFQKLLMDAGLLEGKKGTGLFKSATKIQVCQKRLLSLLALTAVHDIMKMNMILPEVQKQHTKYNGYGPGDTIGDHDHALSYVMEYFPELLPSFRDLDESERRSVLFTQCNLCFNHGWFVQAEAPPGAIFTKFREALIRDHKNQIDSQDVALYFVHWLTDLAGAEPTPLAGCEKFVTKFPLPVLNSFLRSFEFVEKIAAQTETQVMEEYLQMRWTENVPSMGPVPIGDCAIAKMRLLCMAQMTALTVLKEFDSLGDEDRETLSSEMARSGCVGQCFSAQLMPKDSASRLEGPAFLVYYGPAFLQNLGNDSAIKRLSVLAEIYRSSRELWPSSVSKVGNNVTIRIDMIKALSISDMQEAAVKGDVWMLVKHNETEAFVERGSRRKLNKMVANQQKFQVLDLGCVYAYDDTMALGGRARSSAA